jgi:hypothetical protein
VLVSAVAAAAQDPKPAKKPLALGPIRAVFFPPDLTKQGKAQCGALGGGFANVDRCTTQYTVKIPLRVGNKVEVAWELGPAEKKCGTTKDNGIVNEGKKDRRALFAWKHDHPHQGGNCQDEYPHPGRTISVTVKSKKWTCKAEYPNGAEADEYNAQKADNLGKKGPEPAACEKNKKAAADPGDEKDDEKDD